MPPKKTTWAWLTATFFGAGYGKPGPGTYGSIAAALLWFAVNRAFSENPTATALHTLLAVAIVTAIGIPAATRVARESGKKDPQIVVIDEVAGQLLALTLAPPDWQHTLLALLLFRAFDILKPPPVRQLEKLPEGAGIVVDDLAAGAYALAVFAAILHFFPHL
jgi:phosphatidylglycerophosphatase A